MQQGDEEAIMLEEAKASGAVERMGEAGQSLLWGCSRLQPCNREAPSRMFVLCLPHGTGTEGGREMVQRWDTDQKEQSHRPVGSDRAVPLKAQTR